MIKKVILNFQAEATDKAFTYDLVKMYDIKVNILKADIYPGKSGSLLMEMNADKENIDKGIAYLESNGVDVHQVGSKVYYDKDKCINCGMCVSSCITGALSIGEPDWTLSFDPDKCIVCKLCITACPQRLFSIKFE